MNIEQGITILEVQKLHHSLFTPLDKLLENITDYKNKLSNGVNYSIFKLRNDP
ncbi:MAG: hypothetical protein WC557_05155 [Ignavibacteriaceae bacterium]